MWSYDLSDDSWAQLSPSGSIPSARDRHSAVLVPSLGKFFIFGGVPAAGSASRLNDLWFYDVADNSWTQLSPSGTAPEVRGNHIMELDTSSGKLLVHGGHSNTAPLGDFWSYDLAGNSWAQLSPPGSKPSARYFHGAAIDASSGKLFIHGGGGGFQSDLWSYDLAANSWAQLSPSGSAPPGRHNQVLALDTSGKLLLYGGIGSAGTLGDAWSYDLAGNSWAQLSPGGTAPAARSYHAGAVDASSGRLLIHGGYSGSSTLDDLWQLAWTDFGIDSDCL